MGKNKLESLQFGRAIAILLVLLYHLIPIEDKYYSITNITPNFFKIGNVGVDIFFVLSGVVIYISSKKYTSKSSWEYLHRRMKRVYLPYWFYSILLLPLLYLFPDKINSSQNGELNLITSFLLIPDTSLPLLIVAWSLIHEVYFYLTYFIKIKLGFSLPSFLLIMFIIPLILNLYNIGKEIPLLNLIKSPLNIEFLLGIIIGSYIIPIISELKKYKLVIFLIVSSIITIVSFIIAYFTNDISGYLRLTLFGIPACLIIISLIILEIHFKFRFEGVMLRIGDSSYSLYLNHILSLNFLFLIASILFPNPNFAGQLIIVAFNATIAIIIGDFSYNLIERKIFKLIK